MTRTDPRRTPAFVAACSVACLTLVVATLESAEAARGKRSTRRIAKNLVVEARTPLGLQGTAGAGDEAILPVVVTDRSGRRVELDVEYGVDLDGDGVIADGTDELLPSEYRPATQDHRDPRDTTRIKLKSNGKRAVTVRPSRTGSTNAFAWNHVADLGRVRIASGAQIVRDEVGRVVYDPFDGTQPLFTEAQPGVVLRVRATRRGGKRQRSEWEYTDAFTLDNSAPPSATLDSVVDVDVDAGLVELRWTGYDDDSEDKNGNGRLDVLDLEDVDGDGQLDTAPLAVAFDYHRLADDESIPATTRELGELRWNACAPAEGLGDGDVGLPSAPERVGRSATFVWDFHANVGDVEFAAGRYLIRAVPYDENGNVGDPAYLDGVVEIRPEEK